MASPEVSITIKNLTHRTNPQSATTVTLSIPARATIRDLVHVLVYLGYDPPPGFDLQQVFDDVHGPKLIGPVTPLSAPLQLPVTTETSTYSPAAPAINIDEPLVAFYNATLRGGVTVEPAIDQLRVVDKLHGAADAQRQVVIKLQRADGGEPALCPLLQEGEGQTFLVPVPQAEAVSLAFEHAAKQKPRGPPLMGDLFAVMCSTGGGAEVTSVVVPQQNCVSADASGRQFVAGTELQLKVAPPMRTQVLFRTFDGGSGGSNKRLPLDISKTPRELGLQPGQYLLMVPVKNTVQEQPWPWELEPEDILTSWDPAAPLSDTFRDVELGLRKPHSFTRPTYIHDLCLALDRVPTDDAVTHEIAAVKPLTVEINDRPADDTVSLEKTRLTVSPFEDVMTFQKRVRHEVCKSRYGDYSVQDLQNSAGHVVIENDRGLGAIHSYYKPLHEFGVKDGGHVNTDHVGRRGGIPRPEPPPPTDWEVAITVAGLDKAAAGSQPQAAPAGSLAWNWSAAAVVRIQLLKATEFEARTGFAAPLSAGEHPSASSGLDSLAATLKSSSTISDVSSPFERLAAWIFPAKLKDDVLHESLDRADSGTAFWFLAAQIRKAQPDAYAAAVNKALDRAILYGSDAVVDLLLGLGADANFKAPGGWLTPFERAKRSRRPYVMARLVEAGCDCGVEWKGTSADEIAQERRQYAAQLRTGN